jgi:hypothetical protein
MLFTDRPSPEILTTESNWASAALPERRIRVITDSTALFVRMKMLVIFCGIIAFIL